MEPRQWSQMEWDRESRRRGRLAKVFLSVALVIFIVIAVIIALNYTAPSVLFPSGLWSGNGSAKPEGALPGMDAQIYPLPPEIQAPPAPVSPQSPATTSVARDASVTRDTSVARDASVLIRASRADPAATDPATDTPRPVVV